MTDIIKPGKQFKNDFMELTVLCFAQNGGRNVALLIRHDDGSFITVRNLTQVNDMYHWVWGNYYLELKDALKNYNKRMYEL